MGDKSWWEKHRGKVQVMFDILSAAISPFITWKLTSNYFLTYLSILFGPLLIHSIINMIEFNAMYPKMRLHLHSVLGLLKDVAALLDEVHQLDRGKRSVSLSIAIKSLNSLTEKGFIEVDVPYYDFLDYIKALSKETDKKIFGTSTLRRPKELANDYLSKGYLNILLENKRRKMVRVTVLSNEDVVTVVQEALTNLRSGNGSPGCTSINDIPEIEWWVRVANEVSYRKCMTPDIQLKGTRIVLWTTHSVAVKESDDNHLVQSSMRPGTIDDYAVFDDAVVIKFRENRDVAKGILFLTWGANILRQYTKSSDKIKTALEPRSALTLGDLGLYTSFQELLKNITPSPIIDISSYPIIIPQFSNTTVALYKVYEKIIELVNSGQAQFDTNYTSLFS